MPEDARALLREKAPDFPIQHAGRIVTDTTEFMDIGMGDVIRLGDRDYLVLRDEAERRFGMEDPKYWVKRCRELGPGTRRILKLVFYETFPLTIGSTVVTCTRSPQKEERILDLVRGDPRFMQGQTFADDKGNPVRVLDVVPGRRLDLLVENIEAEHEAYARERLPDILDHFIGACRAIEFLHEHGEKHGDIRRDHLYVEFDAGRYVWIDFDYTFDFHENPFGLDLFGLGNILLFLVGKGIHTVQEVGAKSQITADDVSILIPHRVVNLKKVFPYLPEALNRVLLRFSSGCDVFYESVEELVCDLGPCVPLLR